MHLEQSYLLNECSHVPLDLWILEQQYIEISPNASSKYR